MLILKGNGAAPLNINERSEGFAPTGPLTLFVAKNGLGFAPAVGVAVQSNFGSGAVSLVSVAFDPADLDTAGQLAWGVDDGAGHSYLSCGDYEVVNWDPIAGDVASVTGNVAGSVNSVATGVNLAPAGMDPVVIETGFNARQTLSLIAAATAGVDLGGSSTSYAYQSLDNSALRIAATITAGKRNPVTLTPPP